MIVAMLAVTAASPVRAGVSVTLQPASQTVPPGAEFDLFLHVSQAGSPFNAFDAIIGRSASALTLVQLSPLSLQEGPLMVGACGNRFHRFKTGVDRDTITDVLLCNGVSVTGPGTIYRLRLRASTTPQLATVSILAGTRFYDAGISVLPVATANATVQIGASVGVVPNPRGGASVSLFASPNPSRTGTVLHIETMIPGVQELVVCDLLGREVRGLQRGWFAAGERTVRWDGRDDGGVMRPAGVYFARLGTVDGVVRAALVRLP